MKSPGSTCDVPVTGADFYPTLLELTGQKARPKQHVDGLSLGPLLKGRKQIASRPLFWHYPHYGNQGGEPSAIIRNGDWKLIHYYEDGRDELYNIATDQGEQTDVAAANPDRVAGLRDNLNDWLVETGARMPISNPNFNKNRWEADKVRTREKTLPGLEAQAAGFLRQDYSPKGWWGSEN